MQSTQAKSINTNEESPDKNSSDDEESETSDSTIPELTQVTSSSESEDSKSESDSDSTKDDSDAPPDLVLTSEVTSTETSSTFSDSSSDNSSDTEEAEANPLEVSSQIKREQVQRLHENLGHADAKKMLMVLVRKPIMGLRPKDVSSLLKCEAYAPAVRHDTSATIVIRTDQGGEFMNHDMDELVEAIGATHQTSASGDSQQNGRAEGDG